MLWAFHDKGPDYEVETTWSGRTRLASISLSWVIPTELTSAMPLTQNLTDRYRSIGCARLGK